MAKSKRSKISFSEGQKQYTVIEGTVIAEAQEKMSEAMEVVIREHQKKEMLSKQHASSIILNA